VEGIPLPKGALMLSLFLSAMIHLALLGGGMGIGHPAVSTPPTHGHIHIYDAGSNPPSS
jgi:hypothetical protein